MIQFSQPVLLGAGILCALFFLFYRPKEVFYSPWRRTAAVCLRLIALSALVFLAGDGSIERPEEELNLVVAVDISPSMGQGRVDAMDNIASRARDVMSGKGEFYYMEFDSLIRERTPGIYGFRNSALENSGTDLELSLNAAMAHFPPDGINRLLLLSDGEETAGNAIRALPSLKDRGVRVLAYDVTRIPQKEVEIQKVIAPSRVFLGQGFEIKGILSSRGPAEVLVKLFRNGLEVEQKKLEIPNFKGEAVFEQRPEKAGLSLYRLVVEGDVNDFTKNNEKVFEVMVAGDVTVTMITENLSASGWLSDTLELTGIKLKVCTVEGFLADWGKVSESDVLIIDNVPARTLGIESMERIESLVRRKGTGLLVIGGKSGLGAGGYQGTPLERSLPVVMGAASGAPKADMGLVAIVDTSLSMYFRGRGEGVFLGSSPRKIDVAKMALVEVIRALRPGDKLGLLESAEVLVWHKRPGFFADRKELESLANNLSAYGGGINFYSSILEAYKEISKVSTPIRHIMVICDSNDIDQYEVIDHGNSFDLIRKMAKEGVTLSIFAIGGAMDKDIRFLKTAASLGRGDFYQVSNIVYLPRYFISDYKSKRDLWVKEEIFTPIVREYATLLQGLNTAVFPPLYGLDLVTTKEGAREILVSPFGAPVFSCWKYGKGRAGVFTADSGDKWTSNWKSWADAGLFWAQAIYSLSPRSEHKGYEVLVKPDLKRKNMVFRVWRSDNRLMDDGYKEVVLERDSRVSPLPLERTGLETYEFPYRELPAGNYQYTVRGEGDEVKGKLEIPLSAEYQLDTAGRSIIDKIVSETGGYWIDKVEDILKGVPSKQLPLPDFSFWFFVAALLSLLGEFILRY